MQRLRRKRLTGCVLLLGALTLTSTAALACPTVSDLTNAGIVVTYEDGSLSQFRETDDGVVQNDVFSEGTDKGYWIDALYGAYPLSFGFIEKGAVVDADTEYLAYDRPPDDLKGPTADSYWSGVATILDSQRQPQERTRIAVSAEAFETVEIGGCVYEALPMSVLFDDGRNVTLFDYKYLDALGVAVLVGESFSGDDFPDRPEFDYTPVSIEGRSFFSR